MRRVQKLVGVAMLAVALAGARAAQAGNPEGRWLTQNRNGVVEIFRCGDALCGRLLWFNRAALQDNPLGLDTHNPSPALRSKPLCGLVILWGFRPDGQDHWAGGSAYDPESGHTYSGEMTLKPDGGLSLRGYIGISLFGRSENWMRPTQPISRCPAE